ncbi:unannotated protein [freshwater metagenome]|uniref:Unannotated protein n=1 Tax=freshwater metagenome TaxID=449393 RepID=A0A6J7IVD8_9ZZZZ
MRAEGVQQLAGLHGQQAQVAGVQPHGAQLGAGHLDRGADALHRVVGVHQQRRPGAQGVHLGAEGGGLVVVQQREGVRAGARRRHGVAGTGRQVGRRGEPDQPGRPGRGDRGLLVGAPRAHLDARAPAGRADHPRRGRGDGAVVVEDRQHQGLQQHRLPERRPDGEHGGAGEVELALGVALDVPGELEVGQPGQQGRVGDALLLEGGQVLVAEPEVREGVQQPAGAGEDAVAAAVGEAAGEDLEDAVAVGRAVGEGGGEHRQLVPVGQQCRAGRHGKAA